MKCERRMSKTSSVFVVFAALWATACGSKGGGAKGACEVTFDDVGNTGQACTVVAEAECKDDMSPAVTDLATTKKKSFTAGKTCADVGYKMAGCASVPIAWSFQRECPL